MFLIPILLLGIVGGAISSNTCSNTSCADCHFQHTCEKVACRWDNTVSPNGPVPWCTPPHSITCRTNATCANSTFHNYSTIYCMNEGVCDGSVVHCPPSKGDCLIQINGAVRNMRIDAGQTAKLKLQCNHKCTANVHVRCPDRTDSRCVCHGCSQGVTMECFHGGGYCEPGGSVVVPHWLKNDVWCKTPPIINPNLPFHLMPAYCPTIEYVPYPCKSYYTHPSTSFPFAPNNKCAAFHFVIPSRRSNTMMDIVELASCAKIVNKTTYDVVDFMVPTCVEYVDKVHTNDSTRNETTTIQNRSETMVRVPYFDVMILLQHIMPYLVWIVVVFVVVLIYVLCKCSFVHDNCCCIEYVMKTCGCEKLYEELSVWCEWLECCCGSEEDAEEEEEAVVSRRPTYELERELSRRRHHISIEMSERDVFKQHVDSPVRRRAYI